MLRLLFCMVMLLPALAQAQQPKLIVECRNLKGHNYLFPNAIQETRGWVTDGATGVKVGLFYNTAASEEVDKFFIQYHTASQGWHFPNNYVTTFKLNSSPAAAILLVAYDDGSAELYMFMLEVGEVAVSLMRYGGIIENARLFVGECNIGGF